MTHQEEDEQRRLEKEGRKARKAERDKEREERLVQSRTRKMVTGNTGKKALTIRMTEDVKNDFADIAEMEGVTQGEILERLVRLYDVDPENRLEAWEELFGSKERMLKRQDEKQKRMLQQMEKADKEFQEKLERQRERKRQRLENGEKW